jgi:hypothetical protein
VNSLIGRRATGKQARWERADESGRLYQPSWIGEIVAGPVTLPHVGSVVYLWTADTVIAVDFDGLKLEPEKPEEPKPYDKEIVALRRIVRGAVHNAGRLASSRRMARWCHVKDAIGIGSTWAHKLCIDHGLDPDEEIGQEEEEGEE